VRKSGNVKVIAFFLLWGKIYRL